MIVKELINILKEYDENIPIYIYDWETGEMLNVKVEISIDTYSAMNNGVYEKKYKEPHLILKNDYDKR